MVVKVAGIAPVANASGADMTKAETVTLLNDMCIMAPATLIDSRIQWESIDDQKAVATFTNAGHSVRAELEFNADGDLTNFWSDNRLKASADGRVDDAGTVVDADRRLPSHSDRSALHLVGRDDGMSPTETMPTSNSSSMRSPL